MLCMTLLNAFPMTKPTVSLNMSSLKAKLLYSFHSLLPMGPKNGLSCVWNEFIMQHAS